MDGATLTQTAIYEPGIARSFAPSDGFATQYYHGDSLGTTRMFTNTTSPPSVLSESSYTAFGEQIGGVGQRYGYAGAFGYQTATSDTPGDAYATDFKFMHVGARYYDPATGRFLQRDSIGIAGGLNVYGYVGNAPLNGVDPSGLEPISWHGLGLPTPDEFGREHQGDMWPNRPGPYRPNWKERTGRKILDWTPAWLDNPNSVQCAQWWLELPSWFVGIPLLKAKVVRSGFKWALWGLHGLAKLF